MVGDKSHYVGEHMTTTYFILFHRHFSVLCWLHIVYKHDTQTLCSSDMVDLNIVVKRMWRGIPYVVDNCVQYFLIQTKLAPRFATALRVSRATKLTNTPRIASARHELVRKHLASPIYVIIMFAGHALGKRWMGAICMRAQCRHFCAMFSVTHSRCTALSLKINYFLPERLLCVGGA